MKKSRHLLFEIGTEELPPKLVKTLKESLSTHFSAALTKAHLKFASIKSFATPRRLALIVSELAESQADYVTEKKGPALKLAFDAEKKPTPAALGFARSCGVELEDIVKNNSSTDFLLYRQQMTGKSAHMLLPTLCNDAVNALTFPRAMRWGDEAIEFIRPVHWVTLLFGDEVIPAEILGQPTGRLTYGHRFHHPEAISLNTVDEYEERLQEAFVIVDFDKRRQEIENQVKKVASTVSKADIVLDQELLDENCGITEWPVAMLAKFDENFLKIPAEALISAMKTHQKSFCLLAENSKKLLSHFIFISNIQSKKPTEVVAGNEKVMRARLNDAAFFYQSDCKQSLDGFLERLKGVVFQAKLGDLYQRAERISSLAVYVATFIQADQDAAAQAGLLAKADLASDMVKEFPELQGIMGSYYALAEGLSEKIASAIKDHYRPRFAGDELPATPEGDALALADKIDKLTGMFGIYQLPTGAKDPFGLRRDALGIIRICLTKGYDLSLKALFDFSAKLYQESLANPQTISQLQDFFLERLRAWYLEQGIPADIFTAVAAKSLDSLYDFNLRILAVAEFRKLKEAESLAKANKRVNNILQQEKVTTPALQINENLFVAEAEKNLAACLKAKQVDLHDWINENNYQKVLLELASLQKPVDRFFDEVMVMVEDEKLRYNRLAILQALRDLFLQVADISQLQS